MNIQGFQNLCDGDPDGLRELIELYVTKTTEQMLELEKGIKSHSPSTVSRLAHAVAGANLMVGLEASVPLLRQLEECGDKGDMVKAGILFEELNEQFKAVCVSLKGMIP